MFSQQHFTGKTLVQEKCRNNS